MRGVAARAAAAVRAEAVARWELAGRLLPELRAGTARSNHFGWLPLPARWGSDAFAERARAAGVAVTPASAFAADPTQPRAGVRVCLGAAESAAELARALEVLASVLREDAAAIRAYY